MLGKMKMIGTIDLNISMEINKHSEFARRLPQGAVTVLRCGVRGVVMISTKVIVTDTSKI